MLGNEHQVLHRVVCVVCVCVCCGGARWFLLFRSEVLGLISNALPVMTLPVSLRGRPTPQPAAQRHAAELTGLCFGLKPLIELSQQFIKGCGVCAGVGGDTRPVADQWNMSGTCDGVDSD